VDDSTLMLREGPPADGVSALGNAFPPRGVSAYMPFPRLRRGIGLSAAALASLIWLGLENASTFEKAALIAVGLAMCAFGGRPIVQLAARAFLSVTLVFAASHAKLFLAGAAGVAILALGSVPLAPPFVPRAFARSLGASLVIALAQVLVLLLLARFHGVPRGATYGDGHTVVIWHPQRLAFDLSLAALMMTGAWQLYRLRTWGLALHVAAGLAFGALAALSHARIAGVVLLPIGDTGLFRYDMIGLVALVPAALQIVLLAPVIRAALRRG
jgi:hypothetical protein